jgi:ElaB/YqjD/DUF883 family membrane-anchored ribosome-binding protein
MDQERTEGRQVNEARERVAQDVRSVAQNANVVQRAKETAQAKVDDAKSTIKSKVEGAKGAVRDTVQGAKEKAGSLQDRVPGNITSINPAENPLGMLFAGIAVGFLIGLVLPVTRFESERLRPVTDDMKDRVRNVGTEVVRRGGEVIKETIDSARETASSSLREQAREMGMGTGNEDEADDKPSF